MKIALIALGALVLLVAGSGTTDAGQSGTVLPTCAGFDAYAEAMLEAQETFWAAMHEDGLIGRDPATLSESDWTTLAEHVEAAAAVVAEVEPPSEIADWHEAEIEAFHLHVEFARSAATSGFTTATETLRDVTEDIAAKQLQERDQAAAACAGFAAFYEEYLGLSQLAELLHRQLREALEAEGLSITPEADALLAELAREAAERVSVEPDQGVAWSQASSGTSIFVGTVAEDAALRGDQVVHAESIRDVLDQLCPIWPFC